MQNDDDKIEELLKYLVPYRELEFENGKTVTDFIISKNEIWELIHQAQAQERERVINFIEQEILAKNPDSQEFCEEIRRKLPA